MLKQLRQRQPVQDRVFGLLFYLPATLFCLSMLLDLASLLVGPASLLGQAAFYTLSCALGMVVAGSASEISERSDPRSVLLGQSVPAQQILLKGFGFSLLAGSLWLRLQGLEQATTALPQLLLLSTGLGLVISAGYPSRQADARRKGQAAAGQGQQEGGERAQLTPAISASVLGEGQTLQVEVRGRLLTLRRLEGRICAFQELCPHCGEPLCRERGHCDHAACPQRGVRFELRSGRCSAADIPAGLMVYEASVKDGMIHVALR